MEGPRLTISLVLPVAASVAGGLLSVFFTTRPRACIGWNTAMASVGPCGPRPQLQTISVIGPLRVDSPEPGQTARVGHGILAAVGRRPTRPSHQLSRLPSG